MSRCRSCFGRQEIHKDTVNRLWSQFMVKVHTKGIVGYPKSWRQGDISVPAPEVIQPIYSMVGTVPEKMPPTQLSRIPSSRGESKQGVPKMKAPQIRFLASGALWAPLEGAATTCCLCSWVSALALAEVARSIQPCGRTIACYDLCCCYTCWASYCCVGELGCLPWFFLQMTPPFIRFVYASLSMLVPMFRRHCMYLDMNAAPLILCYFLVITHEEGWLTINRIRVLYLSIQMFIFKLWPL